MESKSIIRFNEKKLLLCNSRISLVTIKDEVTENPKIHIYETLTLSISLVRNVVKGNIPVNKWGWQFIRNSIRGLFIRVYRPRGVGIQTTLHFLYSLVLSLWILADIVVQLLQQLKIENILRIFCFLFILQFTTRNLDRWRSTQTL